MVDTALTSMFYASNIKELQPQAVSLLDSLVVHLTLISLALYNNQDESKIANLAQCNTFSQQNFDSQNQNNYLDFLILIDSLFNVLCHDDIEYWPIAQRAILIIIEISEIVNVETSFSSNYRFSGENLEDKSSSDFNLRPNLVNQALFDYLAEKICHLCYERSWNAKKAG